MKVTMLCTYPLDGKLTSGSPILFERLSYYLANFKGIELHIISVGQETGKYKKNNTNIYAIKKKKLYFIPLFTPILFWKMKRIINEINPDIVHAGSTSYFYSSAVAFLQDKYPVVSTALGIVANEIKYTRKENRKYRILAWYMVIAERYLLSKIPHIIVPTPHIKSFLNKVTDAKIYTVSDGIEFERIQEFQPHKSEKPDVLFMSSLKKLKGVDILIKALPMVLRAVPDLSVYIAGSGPCEDELKSLVKELNLETHVKFLGLITDEEEKYSYYKACKIVVAPSRWDCQPFAVIEGAACGKPTIASDKSNPAFLDDGKAGFIFKSENSVELANKIIQLMRSEKLREEMGKAGLEKVRECDWNRVAEKMFEVYTKVITDFHKRKVGK